MSYCIDILIVEDDPGDIRLALEVLSELEMRNRCMVLSSAEEALDYLRSLGPFAGRAPGLPRAILADLKMPRVDGFELLRQLKSDAELRAIPVVVLSSSDEDRDMERALALGAHEYLVKGMVFESYRAALQELARTWRTVPQSVASTVGNPGRP